VLGVAVCRAGLAGRALGAVVARHAHGAPVELGAKRVAWLADWPQGGAAWLHRGGRGLDFSDCRKKREGSKRGVTLSFTTLLLLVVFS
jgi:hypothetical protein